MEVKYHAIVFGSNECSLQNKATRHNVLKCCFLHLTSQLETSATKIFKKKKKKPPHRTHQILNNKTTDYWSKNKNIETFSDFNNDT